MREVHGGNGGRRLSLSAGDGVALFAVLSAEAGVRAKPRDRHDLAVKPLVRASINDFFQSIAKDARAVPIRASFFGEQAYWTVVGVDGDREEALLGEDGALEVGQGALLDRAVSFAVDGELISWSGVPPPRPWRRDISRSPPSPGPVAISPWRSPLSPRDRRAAPRLQARYRVRNQPCKAKRARLFLALRPFQVNPPTQFLNATGGVSAIREIAWDGRAVRVNGERSVIPREPAYRLWRRDIRRRRDLRASAEGDASRRGSRGDPFGYASGALAWDLDLAAGENR